MFCFKCGTQLPDNARFCTTCGSSLAEPAKESATLNQASQLNVQALPMKWHKFLIYFSLFLTAILNVATAVGYLTGSIYEFMDTRITAEMVYDVFGNSLKNLDTAFGFFSIFFAILAVVTRFSLASYKKDGIKLLHVLYGGSCVVGILYQILAYAICDFEFDSTVVTSFSTQLIVFVSNITYYKKREHMFH